MSARSQFVERWGQIVLLLMVWLLLSAVGFVAARLETVRHAFHVRAAHGIAIAEARAGDVIRVRGIPGPTGATTELTDQSGGLTLPAGYATDPHDPRLEAVGCAEAAAGGDRLTMAACDRAPLLVAPPAFLAAAETRLYHRALEELAIILAALAILGYGAGRLLGGPLGRRVRRPPSVRP